MGGFGSGGWNRSGRLTTDDTPRLDVNYLNRVGALHIGCSSAVSWSDTRGQIGCVFIGTTEGSIELEYPVRSTGEQWHDCHERIAVSWEACRFGGPRPYFHCPKCGRRVLCLYGLSQYLCRSCHGLSYPSQRERESDRAQRKADRIRMMLGGKPGWQNIPKRPKGMHARTYERFIGEIFNSDQITYDAAINLLQRSKAKLHMSEKPKM